ncbi:putative nuclear RNA export factor SDE5 isoform X1 [Papaver somniferum]|uniref:putative nuclear RNA export factor SDE5 isoform X1 n=1 Tax=Papaver somniferum TaxID=3469 RepID=UPI000E6F5F57|nr:putative nuclear RNA export factor SDE5 isoform X1 [Papaver somniferum]
MEESVTRALMESDFVETKVLEVLIGAFSSTFPLREIASAYCEAGRNPDMAAQILYDGAGKLKKNYSNAASVVSTTQCETSCAEYRNSKASKMAVSIGSVSSVIGKGHVMSNTPVSGPRSCILCENVANKPDWGANKGSKPKNLALSVGSASSEVCAMPNTLAYGPVTTTEPLELCMKDLRFDELIDEDVSSDSTAKEGQMHTGMRYFLSKYGSR